MSSGLSPEQEKYFAQYLKERRILVADPSPSSKASLHSALTDLGARPTNISFVSGFTDAEEAIHKFKPQIVISDYNLGARCGLDLMQKLRAEHPDSKSTLFVLVTGNSSQTAVARAAEEDVDAYILKPFTAFSLRQTLMRTAMTKLQPSNYMKAIEAGKKLLQDGQFDDAIKAFDEAKKLNPTPSLACFYLGQTNLVKKADKIAETKFAEGLDYNKIHYKCLIGLYDVLMSQSRFVDAYEIVKRISFYFPANPQRLTSVLKLAIMTKSYDDVERYYQTFTKIDERSEEVIRYVCAALVVCGKYYLSTKVQTRALDLFKKAIPYAVHRPRVMHEIVTSLIDSGLANESAEFLKRAAPALQASPAFKGLELLVFDRTKGTASLSIERGRKLLQEGVEDPLIYQVMVKRSSEEGLTQMTEEMMHRGTRKFPDLKIKLGMIAALGASAHAQKPVSAQKNKKPAT